MTFCAMSSPAFLLTWVVALVNVPDLAKAKEEAKKKANGTVKMEAQEIAAKMSGQVEWGSNSGTSLDVDTQSAISMVESAPLEDLSAEVQLTLDMDFDQIKKTKKEKEFKGICLPHARAHTHKHS